MNGISQKKKSIIIGIVIETCCIIPLVIKECNIYGKKEQNETIFDHNYVIQVKHEFLIHVSMPAKKLKYTQDLIFL